MTIAAIEDTLRDVLIEDLFVELDKDQILPGSSLRCDVGLDSLGFVELREQIAQRFGIVISDDDFTPENFATLSSLSSLIAQRCEASAR